MKLKIKFGVALIGVGKTHSRH